MMGSDNSIVKLKLDVVFKRMFGDENNKDIIAAFLSALLEIPQESIKVIYINNVELAPDYLRQKFSRLDLRLEVDGRKVNVEIQVNRELDYKERTLFYWSKLFSEDLKTGQEYGDLKRTVCINIINFDLFECNDYHSEFYVMENSRHEILSDKFAIHFFELKKINNVSEHKPMEDWLRLIDAETEDDLMAIQQTTQIPEVQKTIVKLRRLSADEQIRQEIYLRERILHDEATQMGNARREGIAQGRAEGRAEGIAEGRAEMKDAFIDALRRQGFTEDMINGVLERME